MCIAKSKEQDFNFFLKQRNFLKVVDTLERFQGEVLDLQSVEAKNFLVFKRQLYQMYEVHNRSVWEHELFSFEIERKNLKWVYQANEAYIREVANVNALERIESHVALKGKLYKQKSLSMKKVRGASAFALSASIYTYLPYVAAFTGATLPVLGGFAAVIYGALSFAESQLIRSIEFITEPGQNEGKLLVKYGISAFVNKEVIVDVKDIMEVASLDNDTIGYSENDTDHLVEIKNYYDKATG